MQAKAALTGNLTFQTYRGLKWIPGTAAVCSRLLPTVNATLTIQAETSVTQAIILQKLDRLFMHPHENRCEKLTGGIEISFFWCHPFACFNQAWFHLVYRSPASQTSPGPRHPSPRGGRQGRLRGGRGNVKTSTQAEWLSPSHLTPQNQFYDLQNNSLPL